MTSMISRPNRLAMSAVLTLALTVLGAAGALAACSIGGQILASPAPPSAPAPWMYTLTVNWDTGTQYALSHFELLLEESSGGCSCEDLSTALMIPSPAGDSSSPDAGLVNYASWVECNGEPSLGLTGQFIKFEPLEGQMDEPGTTGTGTYVFYSNYAPAPIAPLNLFLSDKSGQGSCSGTLTGVFPGLPCDPTADEARTWGSLKAQYGS